MERGNQEGWVADTAGLATKEGTVVMVTIDFVNVPLLYPLQDYNELEFLPLIQHKKNGSGSL